MAKRGIYFVRWNQLFVKTIDVMWDKESMQFNKAHCSEEIFKSAIPFMQPCIDVSHASSLWLPKSLSLYNVVDGNGNKCKDMWDLLDNSKDKEFLPPGSYDVLYLRSLSEKQIYYALSVGSFYDTYFNKDYKTSSPSIALCALQLLYGQNKLDYLDNMNMFLEWYWTNCRIPLEYNEEYRRIFDESS